MRFMPFKTHACIIRGDDLVVTTVSGTPFGGRVRPGPVIEGFLDASPSDVRRALGSLSGGKLMLTLPGAWCSVRPIALTTGTWNKARAEIMRSIEGFLPLSASDAMVGLVNRCEGPDGLDAESESDGPGGYLVGASRQRVRPWLDQLEQGAGRPVDIVMAPQMALLGLGLQHDVHRTIVQRTAAGRVAHRLRYGRVERLESRWDPEDAPGEILELPGESAEASPGVTRLLTAHEVAVASALTLAVRPGDVQPLTGRGAHAGVPWLIPIAATLLGGALVWGALNIADTRYNRATASMQDERAAIQPDLEAIAAAKQQTALRIRMINTGVNAFLAEREPILPVIHAAHMAVPADGFLYSIDVTPERVQVTGEAPDAGRVRDTLDRQEAYFENARHLYSINVVQERGLEKFDIEADRSRKGRVQ